MALNEILVSGVGQGGNFLTTVQRVKEEMHRAKQVEEDSIRRALISAIEHYKWTRFHFNEASASMLTAPGVNEYGPADPAGSGNGYPADLLEIDRVQIFQQPVVVGVSPVGNRAYLMSRVDPEIMRYWSDSSLGGGRVAYYYAYFNSRFFVYPRPADAYRIRFDYLADLDHPRAQFVDGEWAYFDRTGSPIEDDYSTPWLDHAEELIRNRAKADLWASVFYSTEKAQVSRGQEMDALRELKVARHKQLSTGYVRPYFGGSSGGGYF